jgi:hypothetical protein
LFDRGGGYTGRVHFNFEFLGEDGCRVKHGRKDEQRCTTAQALDSWISVHRALPNAQAMAGAGRPILF